MDVTIIGTGNMARGIGSRVLAGGHNLTVVGKDRERAEQVAADLGDSVATAVGDPPDGDLFVLAVYYPDARAAVEQHAGRLAGKPVVDITNPVNETVDGLVVPPDSSATQELAKLAPEARLVKAFNTTFATTLTEAKVAGQPLDVLIAGDDEQAKAVVSTLADDGGLKPIDTGPAHRARELEALGLLHMTVQGTLGTNFASTVKFLA
jgi:8-hydroxy-5-deazaflavin:NADPH oxidoreductase